MEQSETTLMGISENGIQTLVEMGFTREKAEEAMMKTGNQSVELAASYLLNNDSYEELDEWEDIDESYKMVFVVNSDLKMSIGKTAAQVAHGCLGLYREIEQGHCQDSREGLDIWIAEGQKKIVLAGKDTDQLKELHSKAKRLNIQAHLVQDAGHTEVAPGSITVLAIFGSEENVNKITGPLRLLK